MVMRDLWHFHLLLICLRCGLVLTLNLRITEKRTKLEEKKDFAFQFWWKTFFLKKTFQVQVSKCDWGTRSDSGWRIYAFRFHTRQDHARWQLCFGNNSTHFQLFTNVLQKDSIESVGLFAIWLQMKWVDWLLSKKIWSQFGGTPQLEAQPQRCAGFSAVFNPVSQYAVCYPQRGGESQQRHHRACPPALPCAHHPTMPSVPQLGHQRVFQEEDQINSQKRPSVQKPIIKKTANSLQPKGEESYVCTPLLASN